MNKKLYRPKEGRMLWGVCAGLAEYLELDVSLIRIFWVIFTLCGGMGIIAYIIAAIIIPTGATSA